VTAEPSIDTALEHFLAEQRERLADSTYGRYENIVDLLRICLNDYGHTSLHGTELERWQAAYDGGNEEAFTRLFGPDRILDNYGEFLGYFMIRKVMASEQDLKDAGTVTKKLATFLTEHGYVAADAGAVAFDAAAEASHDLPRADKLATLLYDLTRDTALPGDPNEVPEQDWVEDYLPITRVEPGKLWFDDHGPVSVPTAASQLAQVGWDVNVVLARVNGTWKLVEVGNVYP
jgi:hypothetical protein